MAYYGSGTPGVGICPQCGARSLPPHDPAKSLATAVACQNPACGFVVELGLNIPNPLPVVDSSSHLVTGAMAADPDLRDPAAGPNTRLDALERQINLLWRQMRLCQADRVPAQSGGIVQELQGG